MNLIRLDSELRSHPHTIDTLAQSAQKWFSWAKHMGSCLCYWPDYFSCLEIKLRRTYPPPWVGWKTISGKQSMLDKHGVRDSEATCLPAFKVVVWLRRQQLTCLSTHGWRFHLFPCQSVIFFKPSLFSGWITTTSRSFSPSLPSTFFNLTAWTWNAFRQTHTYVFLLLFFYRSADKMGTKTAISRVTSNYSVAKSLESRVL